MILWPLASFDVRAQESSSASAVATTATADSAWGNLRSISTNASTITTSPTSIDQLISQQVSLYQQMENTANLFSLQFPNDSRAASAKKIEAMAQVQIYSIGGAAYGAKAKSIVTAFRSNPAYPLADRFDVALAFDSAKVPLVKGQRLIDSGPALKELADNLHGEFGDQPPVYSFYRSILREADITTSVSVAQAVLGMNAPDWVTTEAQAVLARHKALGNPINVKFTLYGGKSLDITTPTLSPTLIYFWTNRNGLEQLTQLSEYRKSIPDGTRVIYVCLQADMT
jgi:hypothetical protein